MHKRRKELSLVLTSVGGVSTSGPSTLDLCVDTNKKGVVGSSGLPSSPVGVDGGNGEEKSPRHTVKSGDIHLGSTVSTSSLLLVRPS